MDALSFGVSVLLWTFIQILECGTDNSTLYTAGYKHPDVEAERHKERIIGICVGVGLAVMFLFMLCISYNYYKHKAYPQKEDEVEITKKPQPISRTMPMPHYEQHVSVESITQDTKF